MENMSEKNWPMETKIPVLWGDMDSFGHVNNIIYLKWCETSRIELFRKMWNIDSIAMNDLLERGGTGPILANFNANYRIPVKYPDKITVKTRIGHIGNTSFGIEHMILSDNSGENIVADAKSVVVMINYSTGEKHEISHDEREIMEKYI